MPPDAPLPSLVDSHCHLTWESYDEDLEAVLDRMRAAGVEQALVVATGVEDARRCLALCRGRRGLFPTAGIHPNDVPEDADAALADLEALVKAGGFVAVGETGIDYYRDAVDAARQREAFRRQASLALGEDLPVIVHVRDAEGRWGAFDDAAEVIEGLPGLRGVIHCYTGDPEHARRYLAAGFSISFAGILTFPKGENVRAAARAVPIERTLVETDAPFLAPNPHRGARNEPGFVAHTARRLAELKGIPEADARRITAENARRLFRLPSPELP